MAFSSSTHLGSISFQFKNPSTSSSVVPRVLLSLTDDSSKPAGRISADSAPKARFVARRRETVSVRQLQRPLSNCFSIHGFYSDFLCDLQVV
jgi:hypothetical protein